MREASGHPNDSWALEVAKDLLEEVLPRRWNHSQGVHRRAVECHSLKLEHQLLRSAAAVHDVGYSPAIAHTGFHALDGARHLRSIGVDEKVVRLVAHHSCAEAEGRERGLEKALAEFEHSDPLLEDALIYCDMTTTPDGEVTDVDDRLAEILNRYGPESIVGRFITKSAGDLRAATRRIEAMLRAAGDQPM